MSIGLTFLILFVVFVYGSLLVGLAGLSNFLINTYQLEPFVNMGDWGITLLVALILIVWIGGALLIAAIVYYSLRARGKPIRANQISMIVIFAFLNVFAMPLILWPIIRNNSPRLKQKHLQKLKKMAKSPLIEERRQERLLRRS